MARGVNGGVVIIFNNHTQPHATKPNHTQPNGSGGLFKRWVGFFLGLASVWGLVCGTSQGSPQKKPVRCVGYVCGGDWGGHILGIGYVGRVGKCEASGRGGVGGGDFLKNKA